MLRIENKSPFNRAAWQVHWQAQRPMHFEITKISAPGVAATPMSCERGALRESHARKRME